MLPQLDTDELQQILHAAPQGLAVSDSQQIILWVNPTFEQYLGIKAEEICGHNINELPPVLQPLFSSNDTTVHIPANKVHDDQWYQCWQHHLADSGHTVHYLNDVAPLHRLMQERELLREELREALAIDEMTGMPNKVALFQSLEPQISRSRRYNNLLSIIIMRVDNLEQLDTRQTADLLIPISQLLNDQVRWADIVGKLSDTDFLLVLPETNAEACQKLIAILQNKLAELPRAETLPDDFAVSTRFGYAEWQKGDDLTLLMRKARNMLEN